MRIYGAPPENPTPRERSFVTSLSSIPGPSRPRLRLSFEGPRYALKIVLTNGPGIRGRSFGVLQKNVFKTGVLLTPVIVGMLLLCLASRARAAVLLLAVPVYYLCIQSALSTEYRHILAIHYFLFITAAVTVLRCRDAGQAKPIADAKDKNQA